MNAFSWALRWFSLTRDGRQQMRGESGRSYIIEEKLQDKGRALTSVFRGRLVHEEH